MKVKESADCYDLLLSYTSFSKWNVGAYCFQRLEFSIFNNVFLSNVCNCNNARTSKWNTAHHIPPIMWLITTTSGQQPSQTRCTIVFPSLSPPRATSARASAHATDDRPWASRKSVIHLFRAWQVAALARQCKMAACAQ